MKKAKRYVQKSETMCKFMKDCTFIDITLVQQKYTILKTTLLVIQNYTAIITA